MNAQLKIKAHELVTRN